MNNVGRLLDPASAGWARLAHFGPWELYQVTRPNRSGWARLCVRLRDAVASKRSWQLYWSLREQRFAVSPYARDLERRHPDVVIQLKHRLRDWRPG